MIKFILHLLIKVVTLKMWFDRWCGSWRRAGFFSRQIFCCPLQPRANILSLGVTTISMVYLFFRSAGLPAVNHRSRLFSNVDALKVGYFRSQLDRTRIVTLIKTGSVFKFSEQNCNIFIEICKSQLSPFSKTFSFLICRRSFCAHIFDDAKWFLHIMLG